MYLSLSISLYIYIVRERDKTSNQRAERYSKRSSAATPKHDARFARPHVASFCSHRRRRASGCECPSSGINRKYLCYKYTNMDSCNQIML